MASFHSSERLNNFQSIKHGFFKRSGGVSKGIYSKLNCRGASADDPENVSKNRLIALTSLCNKSKFANIKQIHSSNVHVYDGKIGIPEVDAVVTDQKNIALSISTADCAPILLSDPNAGIIGAAHAGWKGAHSGIIENTVSAMCDLGAAPENISAAIGPCIAQKSYEVGPELYDAIADRNYFVMSKNVGRYMFDLESYVSDRLWQAEITKIDQLKMDTYDETNNFFSYRRTTHLGEDDYGCQISIILQQ